MQKKDLSVQDTRGEYETVFTYNFSLFLRHWTLLYLELMSGNDLKITIKLEIELRHSSFKAKRLVM